MNQIETSLSLLTEGISFITNTPFSLLIRSKPVYTRLPALERKFEHAGSREITEMQ